jgi:CBS domain-containing protein
MKVSELMTSGVSSCGPRTNLAEATAILWKKCCGALPVVDEKRRVVGVITDRDICIALGTRNWRASDISVEDVMSKNVFTCSPEDDVKVALALMHTHAVRRIPVVGTDRALVGVVSLSDVVRHTTPAGDISHATVLNVIKRFGEWPASVVASSTATEPSKKVGANNKSQLVR